MRSKIPLYVAGLVLAIIILPLFIFSFPWIIGAEGAYIVQTGSMEPEIPTGSMILVYYEEPEDIESGEVITFYSNVKDRSVKITHRVIDRSRTGDRYIYLTKGDALEFADGEWRPEENVIGEVRYTSSLFGALIRNYREQKVFFGLIIILSSLIIIDEMRNIVEEKMF